MIENEKRLEQINSLILDIASGKLGGKVDISDAFDEVDAIASGINMLGEELRATMVDRNYFNSVIESIGDILIIFDKDFKIIQLNDKALEIFQYPENNLLNQRIHFLLDDEEKAKIERLRNMLTEQGSIYNIESRFLLASGEKLPVAISVSKIFGQDKVTQGYVLLAKDLKQFYVFSDALKKKNKELETFVYKVSHDLKGPVASIMGLLDLARMSGENIEEVHHYLSHMQSSLQRLDRSIVSLLNFTLANKTQLESCSIFLKKEFNEIISSLSALPGISFVRITNHIDDKLSITTVPQLLRSILQNFVENAIKYRKSNQESTVDILAETVQNKVIIRISDNGVGMSPFVRDRAFDMYFRGESAASGSGLGLFITKSCLEKLGGDVQLRSEEGVGTEVIITIPNLSRNSNSQ